ncbi:hypothetical protein [Tropicimonas sediminicola]|uniref:Uncharacterized protein n=1 Tax=Tropicimonas sediminicola TaxID=1031541 RepID=A0A239JGS9_9RHOB|nr:hypothetical protein [Tropicimonas sediminicola]SNT05030.1 hypothetical protein SAMN05421757_105275 [Tropicimonas sediminicola]
MFKSIAATALSATLALGIIAPTPAAAQGIDQNDLLKILLGIGTVALIAKAVDEANDDDDKKKKEVHVHRDVTKVIKRPAPARNVEVQPQPRRVIVQEPNRRVVTREPERKPTRVEEVQRVIPSACQRTFRVDGDNRVFLTRNCLESEGVRTTSLPNQCERILDMPGDVQNRRVWNRGCLESNGYRIR